MTWIVDVGLRKVGGMHRYLLTVYSLVLILFLYLIPITVCNAACWNQASSGLGLPYPRDGCEPSVLILTIITDLNMQNDTQTHGTEQYLPTHANTATRRMAKAFSEAPPGLMLQHVVTEITNTLEKHRCGYADPCIFTNRSTALEKDHNAHTISLLYSHLLWDLVVSAPSEYYTGKM